MPAILKKLLFPCRRIPPMCLTGLLLVLLLPGCARQQVNVQELQDRIRNVLQLETAEFVYRDLVYRAIGSDFIGIITRDTRVLAEVKIKVTAGIDAADGLDVSSREDPRTGTIVTVTIPHARILSVDADESSIRQFMLKEYGFLQDGRISLLEFSDQLESGKKSITEDALKRGILLRAESNATHMIIQILALAGFAHTEIGFRRSDGIEAPTPGEKKQ